MPKLNDIDVTNMWFQQDGATCYIAARHNSWSKIMQKKCRQSDGKDQNRQTPYTHWRIDITTTTQMHKQFFEMS